MLLAGMVVPIQLQYILSGRQVVSVHIYNISIPSMSQHCTAIINNYNYYNRVCIYYYYIIGIRFYIIIIFVVDVVDVVVVVVVMCRLPRSHMYMAK